jgi:DNA-binding NarL/FixJ family response regulator
VNGSRASSVRDASSNPSPSRASRIASMKLTASGDGTRRPLASTWGSAGSSGSPTVVGCARELEPPWASQVLTGGLRKSRKRVPTCQTALVTDQQAGCASFVVLDDHELVRLGLVQRLRSDFPGANILFSGESLREAIKVVGAQRCDCAVVDLDLGDGRPVAEVVSAFTWRGIPVVVVSALANATVLESAFAAGAGAFVTKRSKLADLAHAVTAVMAGQTWIAADLASSLEGAGTMGGTRLTLTSQERRALALYASGMTMDMVARRMGISTNTVKYYIDRVRDKYTAAGRAARTKLELHRIAVDEGLLP